MKILNIRARNHEVANVSKNIAQHFNQESVNDAHLRAVVDLLTAKNALFAEAMTLTFDHSNLDELDGVRDGYWGDLYQAIEGYSHLSIEPFRGAGVQLFQIMNEFGLTVAHKNYAEESSAIEFALKNFAEPQYANSINVLPGIRELIGLLQQAQEAFRQAQVDFDRVQVAKSKRIAPTQVKREILTIINTQLIPYLNTMVAVNPSLYQSLYDLINAVVSEANNNVQRR